MKRNLSRITLALFLAGSTHNVMSSGHGFEAPKPAERTADHTVTGEARPGSEGTHLTEAQKADIAARSSATTNGTKVDTPGPVADNGVNFHDSASGTPEHRVTTKTGLDMSSNNDLVTSDTLVNSRASTASSQSDTSLNAETVPGLTRLVSKKNNITSSKNEQPLTFHLFVFCSD